MAEDVPPSVAVVTGAGGALGAAIGEALLDAGHHVVGLDRSAAALAKVEQRWGDRGQVAFWTRVTDQTDRSQVDAAMAEATARGRLAGVVANAGYAKFGGFLEMAAADWQRHIDVNLTGTFHVCQAAAREMARQRRGGWLTVISSNLATNHADRVGAYCTSKAALLHLVRTAAAELGVHRIRVNTILPGVIDTAMTHGMLDEPGVREGLLARTPMGRLGEPADIASMVVHLASEQATWITGASLLVDGGQSIYGQPTWIAQDRRSPHEPRWVSGYAEPDNQPAHDASARLAEPSGT